MSFRNSKTFAKVVSIPNSKVLFGTFRVRFLSPAFAQPSQSNIKIYTWTWIQLFLHLCRWFLNWSNSMKYGKHECRLSEQTAWVDQPVGSNSSSSRSSCGRSTRRSRTSRSSSTSRGSKSNMSSSAVSNGDSWESQLCSCISTFAVLPFQAIIGGDHPASALCFEVGHGDVFRTGCLDNPCRRVQNSVVGHKIYL